MKERLLELPNGYVLYAISDKEPSPMENHLYGEIAADDEAKRFYVHQTFIHCNGLASVINACKRYQPQTEGGKSCKPGL